VQKSSPAFFAQLLSQLIKIAQSSLNDLLPMSKHTQISRVPRLFALIPQRRLRQCAQTEKRYMGQGRKEHKIVFTKLDEEQKCETAAKTQQILAIIQRTLFLEKRKFEEQFAFRTRKIRSLRKFEEKECFLVKI
jgi:hypothetical protein